eukprot:229922-Prymnesium_polylepis.1
MGVKGRELTETASQRLSGVRCELSDLTVEWIRGQRQRSMGRQRRRQCQWRRQQREAAAEKKVAAAADGSKEGGSGAGDTWYVGDASPGGSFGPSTTRWITQSAVAVVAPRRPKSRGRGTSFLPKLLFFRGTTFHPLSQQKQHVPISGGSVTAASVLPFT